MVNKIFGVTANLLFTALIAFLCSMTVLDIVSQFTVHIPLLLVVLIAISSTFLATFLTWCSAYITQFIDKWEP